MKVCVVDPSLFTLPYDQQLCGGLHGQGVDVTLCGRELRPGELTHPHEYPFERRFYRWTEPARRRPNKWCKAAEHLWSALRVSRWLRTEFDVIHFQWSPLPAFDGWLWRRLARERPVVFTVHDTTPFLDRPTSRGQRWGWRRLLDRAHRLIVHTQHSATVLRQLGIPADRIAVIPHGPLYPAGGSPQPVTPATATGEGRRTLLVFGEIKPYKGIDVLLRAAAQVPEPVARDWRIVIAGRPRCDLAPLQNLAAASRLPVVWRTEFVPENQVRELFESADAIAFPYRQVDASGALMLALPFARPVLATRIGLFAELLEDGVTAVLAQPGAVESLAQALTRLLGDADLRTRLAANVRARISTLWSWDHIASEHLRVYRALLAKRADLAPATLAARAAQPESLAR